MRIKEAKLYLDILEKIDTDPELVFTSLFGIKGNTIEETDLLNLYYKITDFDGLSFHQYIKKAICKILLNKEMLASISISDPTHINVWLWDIEYEKTKEQNPKTIFFAQIDLYHKTYEIHSHRQSYLAFINEVIEKKEPRIDETLVDFGKHLNMTPKDRWYLMKKDIKKSRSFLKSLSYIWFHLTMTENDKISIRNAYNERMSQYESRKILANDNYLAQIKQQEEYKILLPAYEKREILAENYIRKQLNRFDYSEKRM